MVLSILGDAMYIVLIAYVIVDVWNNKHLDIIGVVTRLIVMGVLFCLLMYG